jgi:ribonuclease R
MFLHSITRGIFFMRRQIFTLLGKNKQGLTLQKIVRALHIKPNEKPLLEKSLKELQDSGAILRAKKKYFVRQRSNLVGAKLISVHAGYGFVRPEDELLEDIFIPARLSGGALLGDRVEVLYKERGAKGKNEGRVVRILERAQETMIAAVKKQSGKVSIFPFDSLAQEEHVLTGQESKALRDGQIVKVNRKSFAVSKILGFPDDEGVDTQVVIERFGLASTFLERTVEETKQVSMKIGPEDVLGRKDYRDWKTVTIDGPDAQDFDDAVSIRKIDGGNYLLGVHIADVSHYIREGSSLDEEAFRRGTSVYFPDRTLPMLPEKISNHICSLRPMEDKLTVSVLLEIDRGGNVLGSSLHPSLIRTVERMTYDSVYRIFEGDRDEQHRFSGLVPDLNNMRDLADALRKNRRKAGSLDFDIVEPELVYEGGKLRSVVPLERNEAHCLIEEFMVAANEAVAFFLLEKKVPLIFRIHPPPAADDVRRLKEMLSHFGILLPDSRNIRSKDLQSALDQAEKTPEKHFVASQVLRSLRWALYSDENQGHFGLAKREYTHFTSPIRRYPDLVVHRILKTVLLGKSPVRSPLDSISTHCSESERKADEAERELMEWRIYRYMKTRLGDELDGIIINITRPGLVVELKDLFVSGMIPSTDLAGDYFYKRTERSLVGSRTGHTFSLGQRIRVVLASVDPFNRRIILSLP